MPTYTYRCQDCQEPFETILRVSQCDTPQDCPQCDSSNTSKTITSVNFVLKGDSWPGKNEKIRNQMMDRRKKASYKQEELKRDATIRLTPNVGGERVDSWQEAKSLAASQGKNVSGYDTQIAKVKSLESKIIKD